MSGTCSTHVEDEKFVQNIGPNNWRKETTWEI